MNGITSKLDSIADSLESKGMVKEARDIDAITDKIESDQRANMAEFLDYVADGLEEGGFMKEAADIDILSNTIEQPGADTDPRSVLQAIKSMGTKSEVAQYLKSILQKAPGKFQQLVDTIWEITKDTPISGLGRSAS